MRKLLKPRRESGLLERLLMIASRLNHAGCNAHASPERGEPTRARLAAHAPQNEIMPGAPPPRPACATGSAGAAAAGRGQGPKARARSRPRRAPQASPRGGQAPQYGRGAPVKPGVRRTPRLRLPSLAVGTPAAVGRPPRASAQRAPPHGASPSSKARWRAPAGRSPRSPDGC